MCVRSKPKGTLAILGTVAIMLGLVGACDFDWRVPGATPALAPSPTPTSVLSPTLVVVPFWRDIVPGKTTSREVLERLGKPNTKQQHQDLEVWNYYSGDLGEMSDFDRLVFQSDTVQLVTVGTFWNESESMKQYLHKLGVPEDQVSFQEIMWDTTTYIYAQQGFAITGIGDTVLYKQYFLPMSLQEFMTSWGQYYPEQPPFPRKIPARLEELKVAPGQTTKTQLEELLGPPDRVGVAGHYGYPAKYQVKGREGLDYCSYLLPGAIGGATSLEFLFSRDMLILFVCPGSYSEEMNTLGDLVAKFGEPDGYYESGVKVEPPLDKPKIHKRVVFAQKGVAVISPVSYSGPTPLNQILLFLFSEPMILEEYQEVWDGGWFQEPVFVLWKGFDS